MASCAVETIPDTPSPAKHAFRKRRFAQTAPASGFSSGSESDLEILSSPVARSSKRIVSDVDVNPPVGPRSTEDLGNESDSSIEVVDQHEQSLTGLDFSEFANEQFDRDSDPELLSDSDEDVIDLTDSPQRLRPVYDDVSTRLQMGPRPKDLLPQQQALHTTHTIDGRTGYRLEKFLPSAPLDDFEITDVRKKPRSKDTYSDLDSSFSASDDESDDAGTFVPRRLYDTVLPSKYRHLQETGENPNSEKTIESISTLLATFAHSDLAEGPYASGHIDGLSVRLMPHQIIGVHFLLAREKFNIQNKGGLLCDDMGLGKTVQSIALILANPMYVGSTGQIKATLVVAPLALVHQWAQEIKEKAPRLKVIVYHGPIRSKSSAINFHLADVVVTTFQVVANEHESNGKLFGREWWRLIIDEAHSIKNTNTKASKGCCALASNRRWCLTGTPIQNKIDEMQSLLFFLEIAPFNSKTEWARQITKPLASQHGEQAMQRLHVVLGAIMLRRTKKVLGSTSSFKLPERRVHKCVVTFSVKEKEAYKRLESRAQLSIKDTSKSYVGVLTILLRLRQACNHLSLATGDPNDQDEFEQNTDATSAPTIPNSDIPADLVNTSSSKMNYLSKILTSSSDSGRKTIIFSQFTSMLNLIERLLKSHRLSYTRYDGSMTPTNREASLARLRQDPTCTVLLCSLKCGALGLNLTCASRVVLMDPWWNPQVGEQAIDRVHRVGQTRDVDVYELYVAESVEERIMGLQEKKRELAKSVIEGGNGSTTAGKSANGLTRQELLSLFG